MFYRTITLGRRSDTSTTRQLSKDPDGVACVVGFFTGQTVNGKCPPGTQNRDSLIPVENSLIG
jgi:hypothetical protein